MKIKSIIILTVLTTTIFVFTAIPITTRAACSAGNEITCQINALLDQIKELQAQIAQLQAQQDTTQTWCHTFNKNLRIGDNNQEIDDLRTALYRDGERLPIAGDVEGTNFDDQVAASVVAFQEKYASDILTPSGLKHGTGYVGPATRAKLNKLFGCSQTPISTSPVIQFQNNNSGNTVYTATRVIGASGKILDFKVKNLSNERVAISEIVIGSEGGLQPHTVFGQDSYGYQLMIDGGDYVRTPNISITDTGIDAPNGYRKFELEPALYLAPASGGFPTANVALYAKVKNDSTIVGQTVSVGLSNVNGYGATSKLPLIEDTNFDSWARGEITISNSTQPSVTVTSPNGGENLQAGKTYNITWSSFKIERASRIKIKLYNEENGRTYTIADNIASTESSFLWAINPALEAGEKFKIEVISSCPSPLSCTAVLDKSDNYFGISAASAQTSIMITSPNGGEVWKIGETRNITWNSLGLSQTAKVSIIAFSSYGTVMAEGGSIDRPGSFSIQVAEGIANSGFYSWTIPSAMPHIKNFFIGENYYIKILATDAANGQTVSDYSDDTFKITAASVTPSITVTSPNGGETWSLGQPTDITWGSNGFLPTDKINIWADAYYSTLSSSNSNIEAMIIVNLSGDKSSYKWTVPSNFYTGLNLFKIHISVFRNGNLVADDFSDNYFTITPKTVSPIAIISPNGGEQWMQGTTQKITWTGGQYSNGSYPGVDINLYSATCWGQDLACVRASKKTITSGALVNNLYTWQVGKVQESSNLIAPGNYYVEVCAGNTSLESVCSNSANYFSIVATQINQSPVISSVSGPTTITSGQSGTWTINATDPENDTMTYRVVWGDSVADSTYYATNTFTHAFTIGPSYQNPTQYQNIFYAKDSLGNESRKDVYVNVSR